MYGRIKRHMRVVLSIGVPHPGPPREAGWEEPYYQPQGGSLVDSALTPQQIKFHIAADTQQRLVSQ